MIKKFETEEKMSFSNNFQTEKSQNTGGFVWYVGIRAMKLMMSPSLFEICGLAEGEIYRIPHVLIAIVNIVVTVLLLLVVRKLWEILFCPMDLYHDISEIGFVQHDKRMTKAQYVNEARRQRNVGEIPPVYPNGWFRLLDSRELRKEQLRSVFALGEHFAVFRNSGGQVRVMDAYCPHMGANMAAGGRFVDSDCLQCPFHGWKFSGEDGKCVEIPYAKKVPKFISVRRWPVCEINGVIYVWYHCDQAEPTWQIPEITNLGELKYVGRTEHIVNSHVQDIPENAADVGHLGHLHKPVVGRDLEKTYESMWNVIQHDIKASWKPNEDPDHTESASMVIRDATHLLLCGIRIPIKTFYFNIDQIGPGNVHIHMDTPLFRGILVQTITPTEPLVQRLTHSFYVHPMVPMCFAKLFFHLEATQIERDITIWNNKTYLKNPQLIKEESSIARHRRWYQQFYSENSPRLNASRTRVVNPPVCDVNDW